MSCEEFERDAKDAAAGGAPSRAFEDHLETCASCQQRLAEHQRSLQDFERGLSGLLSVEPSAAFAARLQSRLAEPEPPGWRWHLLAPALAVGVAVLLLAGALLRRGQEPTPVPTLTRHTEPRPQPPIEAPPSRAAEAPPAAAARGEPRPGPLRREPEVIVPPGAERALIRFVAHLRRGELPAPATLVAPDALAAALAVPAPIEIAPLEGAPSSDNAGSPARGDS
jgi:hypothetical protein